MRIRLVLVHLMGPDGGFTYLVRVQLLGFIKERFHIVGGWGSYRIKAVGARIGLSCLRSIHLAALDGISPTSPMTDRLIADFLYRQRICIVPSSAVTKGIYGAFCHSKVFEFCSAKDPCRTEDSSMNKVVWISPIFRLLIAKGAKQIGARWCVSDVIKAYLRKHSYVFMRIQRWRNGRAILMPKNRLAGWQYDDIICKTAGLMRAVAEQPEVTLVAQIRQLVPAQAPVNRQLMCGNSRSGLYRCACQWRRRHLVNHRNIIGLWKKSFQSHAQFRHGCYDARIWFLMTMRYVWRRMTPVKWGSSQKMGGVLGCIIRSYLNLCERGS